MNKTKLKRLLDNKGESLMFVMGVMFFFAIISVSITLAAISSIRYAGMQSDYNRIIVLENSIHKNIMFSLQTDDPDPTAPTMLSRQIIEAVVDAHRWNPTIGIGDIILDVQITDADLNNSVHGGNVRIAPNGIRLSFPEQQVIIRPPIQAFYDSDEIEIRCFRRNVCIVALADVCDMSNGCDYVCRFEDHFCCTDPGPSCIDYGIPGHNCCPGCFRNGHECGIGPGFCVDDCVRIPPHHNCNTDPGDCIMEFRERHECTHPLAPFVGGIPPGGCQNGMSSGLGAIEPYEQRDELKRTEIFSAPRIPRTASIIVTMSVTVESISNNGATVVSRATYRYTGGELSDCKRLAGECFIPCSPACQLPGADGLCCPSPSMSALPPPDPECCMKKGDFENQLEFIAGGHGRWGLIRYETVES
jgi:hypothetical protein